jgi:hypothetical protein
MGLKNEIINKTNVKAAKAPRKYKKYLLNSKFEKKSNPNVKRNQLTTNNITIINKIVFLVKFFKPEINLI